MREPESIKIICDHSRDNVDIIFKPKLGSTPSTSETFRMTKTQVRNLITKLEQAISETNTLEFKL